MIGNDAASMSRVCHHLRRPLGFHFGPQRLKRLGRGRVHDPRTRLRGLGVRAFGGRRDQCLDELVAKAHDLVGAHVAADHAVRQARLERLIDDAAVGREIRLTTGHEIRQRQLFRHAAALRMQHPNRRCSAGKWIDQFDLPDPLAGVTAILLQHPRPGRSQPLPEIPDGTPAPER